MKARTYPILSRAIEEGLAHAYRRLVEEREIDPPPPRDWWVEIAHTEIIGAVDEVFDFESETPQDE
jgi:hypothetical protein